MSSSSSLLDKPRPARFAAAGGADLPGYRRARCALPGPARSRSRRGIFPRAARAGLLLVCSLALGACGFQLRTEPRVPPEMARTYIDTADPYSLFYRDLRRELQAAGVELVDNPADATATFRILSDETDQRVLSVSARNVPREYEVYYSVYYELRAGGETLLAPQLQTATRDYRYDETRVLGKASEEELLRRSIASDLVRTVLIQLSSL